MAWRGRRAVLVLAVLAGASGAAAQSAESDHLPSTGGRSLGSHTFVPLAPVPSPFFGTSFSAAFGGSIAVGIIEAVLVDVGGSPCAMTSRRAP